MSPEAVQKRVSARRARDHYSDPAGQQRAYEALRRAVEEDPTKSGGYADGRCAHPHYDRWYQMVARCTKPHHASWQNYGGRGITVCEEWLDPFTFYRYLDEVLGPCPPTYSIDRIDNDGNYEPGNVRWASKAEQCANSRRCRITPTYLQ